MFKKELLATVDGYHNGNRVTSELYKETDEGGNIKKYQSSWHYDDGTPKELVKPCPKCGNMPDKEGHDFCLGKLPGVKNACCGHGRKGMGYIMFENGVTIRFDNCSVRKHEA
jgi:hypothetical protein